MEMCTPRQLLRSLGPLLETSAQPPFPPPTSEKSLQELFQSGGWLEDWLLLNDKTATGFRIASRQSITESHDGKFQGFDDLLKLEEDKRATTNVQNRFVQIFLLSFLLFCSHRAKTLCFEGESPGEKIMKKCEKVLKSVKNYETILPFSFCPLVFL